MTKPVLWICTACLAVAVHLALSSRLEAQWPQYGGPNRDFVVDDTGLAKRWPEAGPKRLWKRSLGDGYACIAAAGGRLFSMYRNGETEYTVAIRPKDGKTLWQHAHPSPFTKVMSQFGPGPHATPLVVGDRVYSVGTNGMLHCLAAGDGKVLWRHDLAVEYGAGIRARGYSCNPIDYKDTVIVLAGSQSKKGNAVLAFDQRTGSLRWKRGDFVETYASPILIRFGGHDQVVAFMAYTLVGFDASTGDLLWQVSHKNSSAVNASMPVWDGRDTLFVSCAYDGGSRAIRLTEREGRIVPEDRWSNKKMKVHFGNTVRRGDYIFGSSGMGTAIFMGLNYKTGEIAWRQRGLGKATCIRAGDKLILLDENGVLALASVTPEGMTEHSRCKVAEPQAWAAPTLVGTTLYVRDRENVMAFDLGRTSPSTEQKTPDD